MCRWPKSVQDYVAMRSALWRRSNAESDVAIRDHMRRDSHWRCAFTDVAARVYHIACGRIENNAIAADPGLISKKALMPSRKTLGRTFRAGPTSTTCAGFQKLPYHCWLEARFHPARRRWELLLHDLPASIRLTAGPTVGLLVPAADHRGRGVFTAVATI